MSFTNQFDELDNSTFPNSEGESQEITGKFNYQSPFQQNSVFSNSNSKKTPLDLKYGRLIKVVAEKINEKS